MTPLAQTIVKNLTVPISRRSKDDYCSLLSRMDDVHCFEVSEAMPLIQDLADRIRFRNSCNIGNLAFLPAPKTWIEFKGSLLRGPAAAEVKCTSRIGFLLEEGNDPKFADVYCAFSENTLGGYSAVSSSGPLPLWSGDLRSWEALVSCEVGPFVHAVLALINTPRIIGRRQHMPHRGFERRLLKSMGPKGYFPLNAWTEIKLDVTHQSDLTDEPSAEAHLTGMKALHFCRAHLRVRLGRVEVVRGHWRGDGSLGIKQSRYVLAA